MRRSFVTAAVLGSMAALLLVGCRRDAPVEDTGSETDTAAAAAATVPEARTEVFATALDDQILVAGGLRADGSAASRVDRYDIRSGRWSAAPDLPEALHHAGMTTFADRVYVAGGYTSGSDGGGWMETDRVWSLGRTDTQWRPEPPLGAARGALGLAATADGLVAFGGTGGGGVLVSAELLAPGASAWRPVPAMAQPREHLAAGARAGRVYAIAGRAGGLDTNVASVESLDPRDPAAGWRPEPALVHSRGGIGAAAVDGTLCVAGGEEPGGTLAPVECLAGDHWREVAILATPRHGLGVVAGRGRNLHVLAGGPQPGLFVSDVHEVLAIP